MYLQLPGFIDLLTRLSVSGFHLRRKSKEWKCFWRNIQDTQFSGKNLMLTTQMHFPQPECPVTNVRTVCFILVFNFISDASQVPENLLLFCSQCELAVDAVHKRSEEEGSSSAPPRREEITDTMVFTPSDLVTMTCRDVDLNFATRGINQLTND